VSVVVRARIFGARRSDAFELAFPDAGAEPLAREGAEDLGPLPLLVRRLRLPKALSGLAKVPLVVPFLRRKTALREIFVREPRVTRLWERFCVDVGVALERDAKLVDARILARLGEGYRAFILEDGDRYAIRAMCIFIVKPAAEPEEAKTGYVIELLHDRSIAGLRAASHLLGQAVREMSDAGATSVRALSFPHSGSYPIFALHAFFPAPSRTRFVVRPLDEEVADVVTQRDSWYLSYLDTEL